MSVREVRGRSKTYIALFHTRRNLEKEMSKAAVESVVYGVVIHGKFLFLTVFFSSERSISPKSYSKFQHVRLSPSLTFRVEASVKRLMALAKASTYLGCYNFHNFVVSTTVYLCCFIKLCYAVHLRTKINDNKMMFEFQKQDDRRRNHNKQSRNSSI